MECVCDTERDVCGCEIGGCVCVRERERERDVECVCVCDTERDVVYVCGCEIGVCVVPGWVVVVE